MLNRGLGSSAEENPSMAVHMVATSLSPQVAHYVWQMALST